MAIHAFPYYSTKLQVVPEHETGWFVSPVQIGGVSGSLRAECRRSRLK